MPDPITPTDLARLLSQAAGVDLLPADLLPEATFEDLSVDSLAMLAVVAEIHRNYVRLPEAAEKAVTVGEFLDLVNSQLTEPAVLG
jgi:acyl carrier protein